MRLRLSLLAAAIFWLPHAIVADPLVWGTVGDSWDAGVAYNNTIAYDDNQDKCLRLKDAWGPQMAADDSWVTSGQTFTFAGCSGSKLKDIAAPGFQHQLQKMHSPSFVAMTSGGNNAGFGAIVDNCIYHGRVFNYGLPCHNDPDGIGECKKSIASANQYINDGNGLISDLRNTIDDIFLSVAGSGQQEFSLYVTGYVEFFNADTTDCNDWTFAPIWVQVNQPLPTQELREALNAHLNSFNQIYQNVINDYYLPPGVPSSFKVTYVSTNEGFRGGRFCEDGFSFTDQFYNDKVLIWNLSYYDSATATTDEGSIPTSLQGVEVISVPDGIVQLQPPGLYTAPINYAGPPTYYTWPQIEGNVTAWSGSSGSSGGNEISNAWTLRPFHPKSGGHTVIKNAVITALQADGLPGVIPSNPNLGARS